MSVREFGRACMAADETLDISYVPYEDALLPSLQPLAWDIAAVFNVLRNAWDLLLPVCRHFDRNLSPQGTWFFDSFAEMGRLSDGKHPPPTRVVVPDSGPYVGRLIVGVRDFSLVTSWRGGIGG